MFERNRVDSRTDTLIAVEVTLGDGGVVSGRTVLDQGKSLHKLLDGDDAFIYIEAFGGEGAFIPKAEIRGIKVMQGVRRQLGMFPVSDARDFDPHRILGLEKDVGFDAIREAYHRRSKLYHPDRYAGIELPVEIRAYLEAMSKNVNAAYRALRYVGRKTEPITTRRA